MGVSSTEDGARKEGFGFQSVHSFIYITYFHRRDSFKGRGGMFSDFQYSLASVFYFPTLPTTMYSLPEGAVRPGSTCEDRVYYADAVGVIVECGESDGVMGGGVIVLPHLFSSGVHNQGGIAERTMAPGPWNKCMMKGTFSAP